MVPGIEFSEFQNKIYHPCSDGVTEGILAELPEVSGFAGYHHSIGTFNEAFIPWVACATNQELAMTLVPQSIPRN